MTMSHHFSQRKAMAYVDVVTHTLVDNFAPAHTTNMLAVLVPDDRRVQLHNMTHTTVRRILFDPVVSCVSARLTPNVFLDAPRFAGSVLWNGGYKMTLAVSRGHVELDAMILPTVAQVEVLVEAQDLPDEHLFPQERISEGISDQTMDDVPVPQETIEVTVIQHERAQQRTDDPIADGPVFSFHNQIAEVRTNFLSRCGAEF